MTRVEMRERVTRETGSSFLIYEEGGRYDVAARYAGRMLRWSLADQLPADADVEQPTEARKVHLSHEEIHELESDTLRNKRSETTTYEPDESAESEPSEDASTSPSEDEDQAPSEDADADSASQAPVTDVPGVGSSTAEDLAEVGVETVTDLAESDPEDLPDGVGPATVEAAQAELDE